MLDFFCRFEGLIVAVIVVAGILIAGLQPALNLIRERKAEMKSQKLKSDIEIIKKQNTNLESQISNLQLPLSRIAEKLGVKAESNSQIVQPGILSGDLNKEISADGGAIIVSLAFPGAPSEKRCVMDYGDKKHPRKNRVTIYLEANEMLNLTLYDNEGNFHQLWAKIKIVPNEIKEIMCLWNQEFGVLALFLNGALVGKSAVKAINVSPVSGEIMFGASLEGEKGMDMLLQQIKIYAFKGETTQSGGPSSAKAAQDRHIT